jgi:Lon protease-like protein
MPAQESSPAETAQIALFPLGTVLYPEGPLPLRIFEARYIDMVRRCMREQAPFGVVRILSGAEVGAVADVASVGTSAHIVDFHTLPDGLLGIHCLGARRFRVEQRWQQSDGLNVARVSWFVAEPTCALPEQYTRLATLLAQILPELGDRYERVPMRLDDASWVSFRIAEILPLTGAEKQEYLELEDPLARLARLNPLIRIED